MEDSSRINPELRTYTYNERDVTLHALGVGACARNALDDKELKFVYHEDGQKFIKVLPTFAAIYPPGLDTTEIPGFDLRQLLHVQQFTEIYRPLPTCGRIRNKASVVGLHDKGKAAVLEIDVTSYGESSDEPIFMNRFTLYLKGGGGSQKHPTHTLTRTTPPIDRSLAFKYSRSHPFAVYEDCTQPSQSELSLDVYAEKTPTWSKACISGRFLHHVYPGETLKTEIWVEGLSVMYQVKVKELDNTVLSGVVGLNRQASSL